MMVPWQQRVPDNRWHTWRTHGLCRGSGDCRAGGVAGESHPSYTGHGSGGSWARVPLYERDVCGGRTGCAGRGHNC